MARLVLDPLRTCMALAASIKRSGQLDLSEYLY